MSRCRGYLHALVAATLVTVLAGCGLLGGSDSGNTGGSIQVEKTKIRVGVLPIIDNAQLYIAIKNGYFNEVGLEVEPVPIQGGAAAVPGLVNGGLDFSFGNWVSFVSAQSKGIDLKLVADGYQAAPKMFMIMTGPNSPIMGPRDLAGKTIAVNTFNNITELTTRAVLQANDVDPRTVRFIELPFPDMESQLSQKKIDAAFLVEPFITRASKQIGAMPVVDTASGPTASIPIAGYAATGKFAAANPKTVAAFQRALAKGQAASADRTSVEEVLTSYAKIDESTARLLRFGEFPTSLDPTRLQRIPDLMRTYGLLKNRLDVRDMIIPPPPV
ncbi:NitT/TauT family transport system substrate-binding protein [Herbihabitans rhizosphaerae]|uniref:NitT/TauT family transport system substrate-binding protein n=1 Tax=Herbihabitans rhizosphaerae TaxID=1872711 RepID=A0A4Q7KWC1_9PSEU|nr:ABC transporter substrate-binding protein [Herbihabitans rhizosphaerae]RZS41054.1 NitT/TauT family transport system substrate-binding protein [Herbihabitans rhizosphaerae]